MHEIVCTVLESQEILLLEEYNFSFNPAELARIHFPRSSLPMTFMIYDHIPSCCITSLTLLFLLSFMMDEVLNLGLLSQASCKSNNSYAKNRLHQFWFRGNRVNTT